MNDQIRLEWARAGAAGAGITQENLKFVLDYLDRRTAELLNANSRLVEERRSQTLRAEDAEQNVQFLLAHNAIRQLNMVEDARIALLQQCANLRLELAEALVEIETLKAKAA